MTSAFQASAFQHNAFQIDFAIPAPPKPKPHGPRRTTDVVPDYVPDVRLVQNIEFPKYSVTVDWNLLSDGTLDDTQSLATAVIVALGTDRLAEPNDLLPDPDDTNRRGWWGDFDAEEVWDGWPIGSRLWLLHRSKITGPGAQVGPTTVRVENYIREAIQPFLDRRVGSQMFVEATRNGDQRIDALVRIYRGPKVEIELRYAILWEGMITTSGDYDIGEAVNPM